MLSLTLQLRKFKTDAEGEDDVELFQHAVKKLEREAEGEDLEPIQETIEATNSLQTCLFEGSSCFKRPRTQRD